MTKKSIISKLAWAVLFAMAGMTLTACGNDEPEPQPKPEDPAEAVWGTSYKISFDISEDVLKAAEVTAHIANPDGTFRDEAVTRTDPSWTLTGNKIPDKAGILLTFVPKSTIDANESYKVEIRGHIAVTSLKNGKVFRFNSYSLGSNLTIKGDRLPEYFRGKGVAFASGVDADGQIISVDTDEFDFGLNSFWEWLADVLVSDNDSK